MGRSYLPQPESRMSPDPAQSDRPRRSLRIAIISAVAIGAVIVVNGIMTRKMADASLRSWTENQAVPAVAVAKPGTTDQRLTIDLPGRLEAYAQAQLFARVSGYLKDWKADIGTPVKAGQLLAEIDAPDLDQQIMQAEASLASAQANAELAKTTLGRGRSLIESGSVSKQDLDQRVADFNNKEGLAKSARANLDRLLVLERYKRIVAPFDGLVTARTTDVGALINAGSSGGPALFVVSDTRKLRVYVNVPQSYVPSIKVGTRAQISVPEYPGQTFDATVEASAHSVDVASGTTRMQLVVDNANGRLMTGAFANIRLELPNSGSTISVPASALIFDQNGLHVAIVGPDNRVILKKVTIARDHGNVVDIGSGLTAADNVIVSPPDGVTSGDVVRIVGDTPATSIRDTPQKPRG
jgi:RND family efflux transporter MFP subunit